MQTASKQLYKPPHNRQPPEGSSLQSDGDTKRRKRPTEKQLAEQLRLEEAKASLATLLEISAGVCWWCVDQSHGEIHDPALCKFKQYPDMTDMQQSSFQARKYPQQQRTRALVASAQARAREHMQERQTLMPGAGPSGQYSLYQLCAFEFAAQLPLHLSAAQLSMPPKSVDAAALQIFAKRVDGRSGELNGGVFRSLGAARGSEEARISKFCMLRHQVRCNADDVRALLAYAIAQQRLLHNGNGELRRLPPNASLLEVLRAVQRKAGREISAAVSCNTQAFTVAQNWAAGGYTLTSMRNRVNYDMRRLNVAVGKSREDVLQAASLIIDGVPKSVTELCGCSKTSARSVFLSHQSSARLHAQQLNKWHCMRAALCVKNVVIYWDEGLSLSQSVPICLGLSVFRRLCPCFS
jgi:hypothetical protein